MIYSGEPLDVGFNVSYLLDVLACTPLLPVHAKNLQRMQQRYPQRWMAEWQKPGNLVTNGAFLLGSRRINDRIRLVKNPRY